MGYAFVFRSNPLAGAAVPLCIGSTHGRTGLGPLRPRRDEIRREHSLELLSRLGVEEFGTKQYRAISASAGVPAARSIIPGTQSRPPEARTGHRAARSRERSEGELPASTGAISQHCSGTGSSGDQAPDTRKPAFSLVLGSLAHDRRLRSDPYDPQRPDVRKRAGGDGRSTPLFHSWFVQRR